MNGPNVDKIGTEGMGSESYTKYPLESAPVTKHGGNDAIHDGIRSEESGHGNKIDPTVPGFGE